MKHTPRSEAAPDSPQTPPRPKPFYREKVFWAVMAGPLIMVILSFQLLYIAQTHQPSIDKRNYYEAGLHVGSIIKMDQAAQAKHLSAQAMFGENGAVRVQLNGANDNGQPLTLTLVHPGDSHKDQTIQLKPVIGQAGWYEGRLKALPSTNHWYLQLVDQASTWRLQADWIVQQGMAVTLKPMRDPSAEAAND